MSGTYWRSALAAVSIALALPVVACGGGDSSGGGLCGNTRCAAGQTCGTCCGAPICGPCVYACAADAAATDAAQDGAPDSASDGSADGGSCPASCTTASDCSTCPQPQFGGWSCMGGVCRFMG